MLIILFFCSDGVLLSAFVELRFWAEVASQWKELKSIEVCQYLIGEKWDDKSAQRGIAAQMKRMGYPNFGFVSNSKAKLEFSRLLRSGKPVLGLVFSPGLRNDSWYFVHVLVVLVVGAEINNRTSKI
jgi:hypothetical protein